MLGIRWRGTDELCVRTSHVEHLATGLYAIRCRFGQHYTNIRRCYISLAARPEQFGRRGFDLKRMKRKTGYRVVCDLTG